MGTKCLCGHLECEHVVPHPVRTRVLPAKGGCQDSGCLAFHVVRNVF